MKITQLKQNQKYRRPSWVPDLYIIFQGNDLLAFLKGKEICKDDFELDYLDIISDCWEELYEKPKYPAPNKNVLIKIKPKDDINEDNNEWIKGMYSGIPDNWIIRRLNKQAFEVLDWKELPKN